MNRQIDQIRSTVLIASLLLGCVGGAFGGPIVHVDQTAPSGGDGASWAAAYQDLQAALAAAAGSGGAVQEIRIAQGIFTPAASGGDRTVSFVLPDGVAIKGGYAGLQGADPDDRNLTLYETILSGDLARDDEPDFVNRGENSHHVVFSSGNNAATSLDGCSVVGGNEDRAIGAFIGAGLAIFGGSPRIIDCTFRDNLARNGGGAGTNGGHPSFTRCTFTGNSAPGGGGLIVFDDAVIEDCQFVENRAQEGAAVWAFTLNPGMVFARCLFMHNVADNFGGGIHYSGNGMLVDNCTFVRNTALSRGGAIYDGDGEFTSRDCKFIGNTSPRGGAVFVQVEGQDPLFINSLFSGNTANFGAAIHSSIFSLPGTAHFTLINCTLVGNVAAIRGGGLFSQDSQVSVTNSILWGNSDNTGTNELAQARMSSNASVQIDYSDVQGWSGGLGGTGNIGGDPQFVDADGGDNMTGTEDDDLRLSPGSPCIDAGKNSVVSSVTDLAGNPRRRDDPNTSDSGLGSPPVVDLGAYEFQPGIPAAMIVGARSAKSCSLGLALAPSPPTSEPRAGGITQVCVDFNVPPGGPGLNPVSLEERTCLAPGTYQAYSGSSTVIAVVNGQELCMTFSPGLENARTYRVTLEAALTSIPGQYVELRGLAGDVNSDGSVNALDRSLIVGAWTGPGATCATDINGDGSTNAIDRSLVVGAWTGGQNCAP